jgi:DNA repair protein RadC
MQMKIDYFTIPEITVSFKDRVRTSERAVIAHSSDAAKILAAAYADCMEHHEEVHVLFLNRRNRVMGILNVAKGGIAGAAVDVRIILQTALKVSATSLILSHNHPGGSGNPGREDLILTEKLRAGCETVGLKLIDHLILTSESYTSFAEEGLLFTSCT